MAICFGPTDRGGGGGAAAGTGVVLAGAGLPGRGVVRVR